MWADPPERQEAGTPDIVGCIAIGAAAKMLERIGWDKIIEHEKELTRYALRKIKEIPGITLYGSDDPERVDDRLGVITFNIKDLPHKLVATILSYEGAIGIRSGGFCAHPYILKLLGISEDSELIDNIQKCSDSDLGAVRASFGMYNTIEEVDEFIRMLKIINDGTYKGEYFYDKKISKYISKSFKFDFEEYFHF